MPIPDFTATGDLPVGVHRVSLPEALFRFGTGSEMQTATGPSVGTRLSVGDGQRPSGAIHRVGSFITTKPEPNDVDVFMIMDGTVPQLRQPCPARRRLLYDHTARSDAFGVQRVLATLLGSLRRRRGHYRVLASQTGWDETRTH